MTLEHERKESIVSQPVDLTRETRIIADWSYDLRLALARGSRDRAATAAATILEAAEAILDALDPQRNAAPAVTHNNGHYIAPEPRA